MDKILLRYTDYMKNEKGLTRNTLDAYLRDILQFKAYLNEKNIQGYIQANKTNVITYLTNLQKDGKATSTISRNLASIRCFFQYLLNNNFIKEDPTMNLRSPKAERNLPYILTEDEVSLLLSQPKDNSFKGSRDKAMLELLYATGLRVSQIIAINICDIDLKLGILKIEQEDLFRFLPIGGIAVKALSEYVDKYRPNCKDLNSPMFINYSGNRLTRQGFWKIINNYTEMTSINKKITPNTLRHSFAVHLINNGANIKVVQEILGHSDLSTTQVYSFAEDSERLREVYKKSHPRA